MVGDKISLDQLPAKLEHDKFNSGVTGDIHSDKRQYRGQVRSALQGALQIWLRDNGYTDDIIGRYCYACSQKKEDSLPTDTPCYFFYYWLGTKIKNKLEGRSFVYAMKSIYQTMEPIKFGNMCTNIYPNISWDMFERSKTLFDYWYNYINAKAQLESSEFRCNPEKKAYLSTALLAYNGVQDDCDKSRISKHSTYCMNIRTKYQTCNPYVLLSEDCGQEYGERTELRTEELQGRSGPLLYSEWIYDMLQQGGTASTGSNTLANAPLTDVTGYSEFHDWLPTIGGAWNLVSKIKKRDQDDNTICLGFYYWLGHLLFNDCGLQSISDCINRIYQELKKLSHENKCGPLSHHNSEDDFKGHKKIFELSQDYNPKKEQLQNYYDSCSNYYRNNVRKTPPTSFPSDVKEQCKNDSGEDTTTNTYCTKFKTTYETYCTKNPWEVGCEVFKPETKKIGDETATLSVSTGAGTVAPIVSSVFGTLVGLPAIAFLLYKHTSLFSGIKSSFGGSAGRSSTRKRRTIESDFDTLTEDTLTEYSTEASRAFYSADESTIYGGRPPSGKRGASNGRSGNRNNISYQRM
ncbi:Uncharacterized protein PCOAH_00042200 [Plasmodium coatneyi]|uniref:KIR protein n=1 Tax=Plasmodium coatneyi TaxID=208452 RepID=A0A1B1E5W3_9APIC|nr:Uncharacterized protein PCOAH_00042200 [Plasmodium coatneyi]ANQ10401.1 Uncharacterized protein PCOAH_00042200 [Plasmodium coatneyi]